MVAIPNLMQRFAGGAAAAALANTHGFWTSGLGGCDVSNATVPIPQGQSTLNAPNSTLTAKYVGVAFGIQNYTCSSNNNYTSAGAVAELFDISCLYAANEDLFNKIQEPLFEGWSNLTEGVTVQEAIDWLPHVVPSDLILSQHFFQPNAAGGISPVWDFRSSKRFAGVQDAYFVGKGLASLPDPANPAVNINWLDIGHVDGAIASEIFRVKTIGGQPPSSCTSGSSPDISVKYSSQYWFFYAGC